MTNKKNNETGLNAVTFPNGTNSVLQGTDDALLHLPEKIVQFGSGSLFRKLHNHSIDLALPNEVVNGRVVLVTSNVSTNSDHAISRVLSAKEQWPEILSCSTNPDLKIIISNKKLVRKDVLKDNINANPPFSYPGKLLALLFSRYNYFSGDAEKGLIIISADKDHNSPETLEAIILELAHLNNLDPLFLDWIENANSFYGRAV
ncbi:MAG TPA: hypothetical protein VF487_16550 [Chitinophagaceae bacterium]